MFLGQFGIVFTSFGWFWGGFGVDLRVNGFFGIGSLGWVLPFLPFSLSWVWACLMIWTVGVDSSAFGVKIGVLARLLPELSIQKRLSSHFRGLFGAYFCLRLRY